MGMKRDNPERTKEQNKEKEDSNPKSCFWGCFGMLMIAGGIVELIVGVITFNIFLIIFSIVSTLLFCVFCGDRIEKIDKKIKSDGEKQSVNTEISEQQYQTKKRWGPPKEG